MSWTLQLGRPFGIPVRVHVSFLLILGLGAAQWAAPHGARGALFGVLVTLAMFACVALHELGHSLAARAFGIRTKQIVLLPIGGVAELDGKAKKPLHELLIAVAGPAVNVGIAVVLAGVLGASAVAGLVELPTLSGLAPNVVTLGVVLLIGNGMLALFNLLPFFPLDGGRVLRAVLAFWMGEHKSLRVAAIVGQVGAVGLASWAIYSGQLLLIVIAGFMFLSAGAARAAAAIPELVGGLRAGDVCEQGAVVFEPATTVHEGTRALLCSPQTVFPVALGVELVGVIGRDRLQRAGDLVPLSCVTGIMDRDWPRVDVDRPLVEVLELLATTRSGIAAVYDAEALVGFVSTELVYGKVIPRAQRAARTVPPARREVV